MNTSDMQTRLSDIAKRPSGPLEKSTARRCLENLRRLAEITGIAQPPFDPSVNPIGTLHLAAMLPTLRDDALRSARLGRAMDSAVDTARAVDVLHAYNLSLQGFFPASPDHMREEDKLAVVVAFDQWDTAIYVADQTRLAAATGLLAADCLAWCGDMQRKLDDLQATVIPGEFGDEPHKVKARHAASQTFQEVVAVRTPMHELGIDDLIGPAIKDRIEYVTGEKNDPDDQTRSAMTH